jgi:adenylate kinase family enzyme
MVILITGSSHTGKTVLAQKLLKKYEFPYLSQDHLKMGLIRSGFSTLTPEDEIEDIMHVLWPISREIIKTCIENNQNLVIEGCYIPFDFKKDFKDDYLKYIKFNCLIFSTKYINEHYEDIMKHASTIEYRDKDDANIVQKKCYLERIHSI